MSIQAISNFITVQDRRGVVQHRYQNGKVGETIELDGANYSYLSFFYRGATRNRTGDNLEAELTLAANQVAMNIVQEAVDNNWMVVAATCSMNPKTFAVGRKLTQEVWVASSFMYDPEQVVATLSSGIDAVGASAPTRALTSKLVGSLPSSGQIANR